MKYIDLIKYYNSNNKIYSLENIDIGVVYCNNLISIDLPLKFDHINYCIIFNSNSIYNMNIKIKHNNIKNGSSDEIILGYNSTRTLIIRVFFLKIKMIITTSNNVIQTYLSGSIDFPKFIFSSSFTGNIYIRRCT